MDWWQTKPAAAVVVETSQGHHHALTSVIPLGPTVVAATVQYTRPFGALLALATRTAGWWQTKLAAVVVVGTVQRK